MIESVLRSERALMRLTLELAWLIESSDAETFEDMATNWLESVAAEFQDLPNDAKSRLVDVARELAAEYRDEGWSVGADFFNDSPKAFGFDAPLAAHPPSAQGEG